MRVSVSTTGLGVRVIGPALLLMLLLAALTVVVAMNRPVRVVHVEAELNPVEQAQVREAIDGLLGQGMLTLDLDEIVATMRGLAWPRLVSVRREWPDGLVVTLIKETFVARWGERGAVNSAGEVFTDVEFPADLPTLRVAQAGATRAMQIFQMLQGVAAGTGESIVALEQDAAGEWHVELDDGFRVALGREQLTARLSRFLAVHLNVLRERAADVAWVDARYSNGVAVRWRGAGDLEPAVARAH
jgi:cell division protein FtsQ